ncbi:hypothetical protein ACFL96_02535 [Thermoproteota archaeon]
MNEELNEEQQVLALIKKLQQQIAFLEKKVDILISKSEQRTGETRSFSKPSRPYGPSQRPGKERYRERFGGRDSSSRFGRQRDGEGRGRESSSGRFDRPRGEEGRGRDSSSGRFDRQRGKEGRGFEQREKPFYRFKRPAGSRKPGRGNKPSFHRRKDQS